MAQAISILTGRPGSTASIIWGIVLVILGVLAIGSPFLAAIAVDVAVAWLIVFAGIIHIVIGFHSHGAGSVIWKFLVGLAYLAFGTYLVFRPLLGVASLTLLLAALFVIEGILNIIMYFKMRPLHGSVWALVDGIITLCLGGIIYWQWPLSSAWAIGLVVGVSMIVSGIARIAMSWAIRSARATTTTTSTKLAA
ncbi:MAG: DUF308 domain-containing protein [Candidatus Sulfotelmatobacter sp.]